MAEGESFSGVINGGVKKPAGLDRLEKCQLLRARSKSQWSQRKTPAHFAGFGWGLRGTVGMEKFIGGLLNCMIVSQLALNDICKAWAAQLVRSSCYFVMDKIKVHGTRESP